MTFFEKKAMRFNVLVLHNLEDLTKSRRSTLDYVLCFERYAPKNNYLYHRITLPVTETLAFFPWDAIIFESTSLGICTFRPRELFEAEKRKWAFLADIRAVKIVFPQDDANHSGLLDDWFDELCVDAVFTVRPEHKQLLYPRFSKRGDVFLTLSGFVDDLSFPALGAFAKPFAERKRDIGQRVTLYPPQGGRHSRIKGITAQIVKKAALERGLNVDISTDPKDVILGDDWFRFLGDCRFTLGSEGGLSIWDPQGEIYDRVEAYTTEHPDASFEEIEAACFPGLDGKYEFPGFSPRVLEAALMGCCQILVEGRYLGVLKPYEHYIPLKKDCSNLDEVFELMKDESEAMRRVAATYQALIENPEFRYSHLVSQVMEYSWTKIDGWKVEACSAARFDELCMIHWDQLTHAFMEHERKVGFTGAALVQRVTDAMVGQYARPLVFPDRHSRRLAETYRNVVEQRSQALWLSYESKMDKAKNRGRNNRGRAKVADLAAVIRQPRMRSWFARRLLQLGHLVGDKIGLHR